MLLLGAGTPGGSGTPTAPLMFTPSIAADGVTLTLRFNKAVTDTLTAPVWLGFLLYNLSGGATNYTYVSGRGTATIVLTLSRTVQYNETGGVMDYEGGGSPDGSVVSVVGAVALANFAGRAVTNNSIQGVPSGTVGFRSVFFYPWGLNAG